jgi:hypothetical protein
MKYQLDKALEVATKKRDKIITAIAIAEEEEAKKVGRDDSMDDVSSAQSQSQSQSQSSQSEGVVELRRGRSRSQGSQGSQGSNQTQEE